MGYKWSTGMPRNIHLEFILLNFPMVKAIDSEVNAHEVAR